MFEVLPKLTPENILERIDQYFIFKFYCPNFKEIDKHFHSELRKDPIPSAVISFYNGRLWYKDFGASHKGVDCFGYIILKYGVNFYRAMEMINLDFNLGLESSVKSIQPSLNLLGFPDKVPEYRKEGNTEVVIKPAFRKWIIKDKEYWYERYGIDKDVLEFFDVRPINGFNLKYITSNKVLKNVFIPKTTITYSYLLEKNLKGIDRYKIYSPLEDKSKKWLTNGDEAILQGYNQLNLHGDNLVITKSLKDIMVLYAFNIASVAVQSESVGIRENYVEILRKRFINITLLFDNDKQGKACAHRIWGQHNIPTIFIPDQYQVKDISDFRHKYGSEKTKELLDELITCNNS